MSDLWSKLKFYSKYYQGAIVLISLEIADPNNCILREFKEIILNYKFWTEKSSLFLLFYFNY